MHQGCGHGNSAAVHHATLMQGDFAILPAALLMPSHEEVLEITPEEGFC